MEIKEFVKKVLIDLVEAVEESRGQSVRDMYLEHNETNRTVEFDIAVAVEDKTKQGGTAGIKVLELVQGGGELSKEARNSTVSRIKFGVSIGRMTREETAEQNRKADAVPRRYHS